MLVALAIGNDPMPFSCYLYYLCIADKLHVPFRISDRAEVSTDLISIRRVVSEVPLLYHPIVLLTNIIIFAIL
jgi:hypothetical protein